MDNQYLQEVSEEKDLGILITSDLKSAAQVMEACKKANRALGMISRTINYKSKSVLLSLYKSSVRPHLEYCTPVWSPHYFKDKHMLEKVQHRFTRMVPVWNMVDSTWSSCYVPLVWNYRIQTEV